MKQAERSTARHAAIERVTEFLRQNYPCDCDQDCGFPGQEEAAAIVEMVEAQFFPDEKRCQHCGEPVYLFEWRWRHTNGMYSCALTEATVRLPRGTRPRAEP